MRKIHNNRNKLLCLLIVLFGFSNGNCFAFKAHGYIITNNHDTINGFVQVTHFDQVTGGLIFNGIEQESFYSRVVFKGKNEKRFKNYFPENLLEFGFSCKYGNYFFKSFVVEHNSVREKESKQIQFLRLIYKGSFELYKYCIYLNNPDANLINTVEKQLTYYDYFLYSKSKGLIKVEQNQQFETTRDLLRKFEFDEKFVQLIPTKIDFNDIKALLTIYDRWLMCKRD